MLKEKKEFYISGFDKKWSGQLVVEVKKKSMYYLEVGVFKIKAGEIRLYYRQNKNKYFF